MRFAQDGRRSWFPSSQNSTEARVLLFPSRLARTETSDPWKAHISSLDTETRYKKTPLLQHAQTKEGAVLKSSNTGSRKHASI